MNIGTEVVRKGQTAPRGVVIDIVETNRDGFARRVMVSWQWSGKRPLKCRPTTIVHVKNLQYARDLPSDQYGWLSPEGRLYGITPERRHTDLADHIIAELYIDEWVQEKRGGFEGSSFLWQRGWIRLDYNGADLGGWLDPTPEQLKFLVSREIKTSTDVSTLIKAMQLKGQL